MTLFRKHKTTVLAGLVVALVFPASVLATTISTHVLDLERGIGGQDIPVVLSQKQGDDNWHELGTVRTDQNGRVASFGEVLRVKSGQYRLTFMMDGYSRKHRSVAAFFPDIKVDFVVDDKVPHYHVPLVVSPFGYSTYRGS